MTDGWLFQPKRPGKLAPTARRKSRLWCLVGEPFGKGSQLVLKGSPFLDPYCQANEVCV